MCGSRVACGAVMKDNATPARNANRQCLCGFGDAVVEACGKQKLYCNGVLTNTGGLVILKGSLQATLLDREAEQTLFDN